MSRITKDICSAIAPVAANGPGKNEQPLAKLPGLLLATPVRAGTIRLLSYALQIRLGILRFLSRNDSVKIGSATVPVALASVPLAGRSSDLESPFGGFPSDADVFGQRPKTASETLALPDPSASFRLRATNPFSK